MPVKPHHRKRLGDTPAYLGLAHASGSESVRDVVKDVHVWEQRVALKHHVERPPFGGHAGDVFAIKQHPARRWLLKPGKDAEQRRLATARRSKQRDELTLPNSEADRLECDLFVELLADGIDPHECAVGLGGRRYYGG